MYIFLAILNSDTGRSSLKNILSTSTFSAVPTTLQPIALSVPGLPHHRPPPLLVPPNPTPNPLHRLPDPLPLQRTNGQNPTIPHPTAPLPLKHPPHKPLLDPHRLHTILPILLIRQHQQWDRCRTRMRQHRLQRPSALLQSAHLSLTTEILNVGVVADVTSVDHEDDRVADGVVARPH